jgi:membrane protease YdiL (CAAX protease family)
MQAIAAPIWLVFALLGLSIVVLPLRGAGKSRSAALGYLWLVLFGGALAAGLASGVLRPIALASIGALFLLAYLAARPGKPVLRAIFTVATLILALALALHAVPGYNNPLVLKDVQLSPSSAPYTLYANFDKGVIGLVLLLLICRRSGSWRDFVSTWKQQAPIWIVLPIAVLGLAWAMGFVRPDVKLPAILPLFAAINLLFVCVAEEAFFRGLIQEPLSRYGKPLAIVVSGLLFGLAHLGGGWQFALLAAVAGLGYALLYARTQRIEIPIAAHLLVNVVHFVAFTYPRAI